MNLPVQHLSDEAVAAFADGMLATSAQNRVVRHIADCGECAAAIAEQRAAASALRAAPAPAMPAGLLERLRAVPVTTPLSPQVMALAPDGSAVFPAFGTGFGATGSCVSVDCHIRFAMAAPASSAASTRYEPAGAAVGPGRSCGGDDHRWVRVVGVRWFSRPISGPLGTEWRCHAGRRSDRSIDRPAERASEFGLGQAELADAAD